MEDHTTLELGKRKSGILKKNTGGLEGSPHQEHHHHHADHVKFDEEAIELHDQDRGTRMKIDEPKTPYATEKDEVLKGESGGTDS